MRVYLTLSILYGVCMMDSGQGYKNTIIVGHRGARGLSAENTLASFKEALKYHVDMVELDVHICKSGHLVVFHDNTLERLTGAEGHVDDFTLAELRKLLVDKKEQIPTLEEVIQFINRRCKINIELKGEGTGKAVALLLRRYLNRAWQPDDFLVTSFNFYELFAFQEALSIISTGLIFERLPIDYTLFSQQFGVQAIMMHYPLITPSFMERAHARNLKVYAWTVNKISDQKKLLKLGVDGVITDYPNKIKK